MDFWLVFHGLLSLFQFSVLGYQLYVMRRLWWQDGRQDADDNTETYLNERQRWLKWASNRMSEEADKMEGETFEIAPEADVEGIIGIHHTYDGHSFWKLRLSDSVVIVSSAANRSDASALADANFYRNIYDKAMKKWKEGQL